MKIFKYLYDFSTGYVEMPIDAIPIRADYINDGFYEGEFIWAIVDPEKPTVGQYFICRKGFGRKNPPLGENTQKIELRVKEKQTIQANGDPFFAGEDNGKLYVFCRTGGPLKDYNIVFYKTGQEINEPVEELTYLGINRLWIVQELGLFSFWHHV